jgi:hypothetical protein
MCAQVHTLRQTQAEAMHTLTGVPAADGSSERATPAQPGVRLMRACSLHFRMAHATRCKRKRCMHACWIRCCVIGLCGAAPGSAGARVA